MKEKTIRKMELDENGWIKDIQDAMIKSNANRLIKAGRMKEEQRDLFIEIMNKGLSKEEIIDELKENGIIYP
jgi:hypothetical protein